MLPKDMEEPPEVLCLHGGGAEGRSSFLLLRHILFEKHAVSSCAFDFYGESFDMSQQDHLNQASDIIDACFDSQPFSIVAADVSAWVALQLAESFPVRQLVLLNPAGGWNKDTRTPCQTIGMPVESAQTLAYMNTQPDLLLKVVHLIKATLQGDGGRIRYSYKEYGS